MISYWIDRKSFSLERYWAHLGGKRLMPGRQALQQDMAARLRMLQAQGITSLEELVQALDTGPRLQAFAERSGLDGEWLVLLRREAQSLTPKPVAINRFPDLDRGLAYRLEQAGIKDSRQLFEASGAGLRVEELAARLGADPAGLADTVAMSDLVRVNGIGPVFARLFLDAGVSSTRELAQSRSGELYDRLVDANGRTGRTNIAFSERDMELCMDMARMLPGNGS